MVSVQCAVEDVKKARKIEVSESVECMGLGCWMISICSINEKVVSKAQYYNYCRTDSETSCGPVKTTEVSHPILVLLMQKYEYGVQEWKFMGRDESFIFVVVLVPDRSSLYNF